MHLNFRCTWGHDIPHYTALLNLEKEQSIDRIAFAHNLCDVQIRKVHQP